MARMIKRWGVIAPLAIALALAGLVTSQRHINAIRTEQSLDESLLYLPNERLLTHLTGGMSSVIADLLWLRCIQYTAIHFKSDKKFTWLKHMCDITTRLDPHFVPVYRYGGMFLASLDANDQASLDLLHRGMVHNPKAWSLPYEAAMVYLLNRGDQPNSRERAAAYLGMSVTTGKAPEVVLNLAQNILSDESLADVEREMWLAMVTSDDKLMRELAERKLREMALRDTCRGLNSAVELFTRRYGKPPESIDVLVKTFITEGLLTQPPSDPLGGRFFLDENGVAQSTTLLDNHVNNKRNMIQRAIDTFQTQQDRFPKELAELVNFGVLSELPTHPYADRVWTYNPHTGAVR